MSPVICKINVGFMFFEPLAGLFILGRTHLYVRDGLVESSAGEIMDARDAPKDVLQVPVTLLADLDPNIRARRW